MNAYMFAGLHPYCQLAIKNKNNQHNSIELSNIKTSPVTHQNIIDVVCTVCGVKVSDIVGKTRKQHVVNARHIANQLIRVKTDLKLKEIGKIFNRDHSTVIHSLAIVPNLLKFDHEFQTLYKNIIRLI